MVFTSQGEVINSSKKHIISSLQCQFENMAEHLSVIELEEEAKKLKRDLEGWREIILPISSILLWEKNSSLGIILGTTSGIFIFLWKRNPSVLTFISILGLIITFIDYLVPTLTLHFCHPERWTSAQERKLESICRSLAANKIYLVNCVKSFYQMRRDRPSHYYGIVITSLFILSFIGNAVDNLLLTYLAVTSLLLLPGMQHHGLVDKYTAYVKNMIQSKAQSSANFKSE